MDSVVLAPYEYDAVIELAYALKRRTIPEVLVSCSEAARLLGVSRTTISAYIKQGRLTKRTMDDVTGILLTDLMRFKENPSRDGRTGSLL